jgi:hypothetical protein
MPPIKNKTPSFLAELHQLVGNLKDLPYQDLAQALLDAGWISALAQTDVSSTATGAVLVSFDVMVGKSFETLERLDTITLSMPPNPGPVSVAARLSARESVLFLMTGRLPPPRVEAPAPAAGQMNGGDERHVDMSQGVTDVYVEEPAELAPVTVVERREPDGLPVFRDLYDIGTDEANSAGEVIDAVLDVVKDFLAEASAEQVDALATKNPDMISFIKDLGRPEDSAELRAMVTARKTELASPAPAEAAPRRRVSALQRAN